MRFGTRWVARVASTAFAGALAACGGGSPEATNEPPMVEAAPPPAASTPDAPPAPSSPRPPGAEAPPASPLPNVPLHTDGRWIVDKAGKRFKLASVNWYGADEKDFVVAGLDVAKLADVAAFIKKAGFNSVRLPWSNELYESNPVVAPARLAKNPELVGKKGMEILDAVIDALAREGLVVILDNHVSRADWCCDANDGNGLWFTTAYPESAWVADWKGIVARYKNQPAVVGVDLRNELRDQADGRKPTWGGADPTYDWRRASTLAGNAVLSVNPDLLVVVEGLRYATDFTGFDTKPVTLSVPHRLVYSAHDYSWFHAANQTFDALHTQLGNSWGFLLVQNKPYTAPVWVGEFGTRHDAPNVDAASGAGLWFKNFRRYLAEADIDWAYWALNGTQATGTSRTLGAEESFGVMNKQWTGEAFTGHLAALKALVPATQGPK